MNNSNNLQNVQKGSVPNCTLYPLLFEPNLHEIVWGGDRLTQWKGLAQQEHIGESWEVSAVESSPTVVANGAWAGRTLPEVVSLAPEGVLGKAVAKHYGMHY